MLAIYFFTPFRTNVLVLGVDDRTPEGNLGRTDTMILGSIEPLKPYVGLLSIPRDLWVDVPGYGENRINTAHFFAEANQRGSGPTLAIETVKTNFGVEIDYFVRIRFESIRDMVNALGGVAIDLTAPTAGLSAGKHNLNGEQALAFVRDRRGDDFFRMANGQLFLKAVLKQLLYPNTWPRLPTFFTVLYQAVDTNVPLWQLPRLGIALMRVGPDGLDTKTLTREEVQSFTTANGANVLLPNWEAIGPIVAEMFRQ